MIPNKPTVYLSGPIGHCTPEQVHSWRDKFTAAWGKPFVRDPTDRVYTVEQNYSHANEIVVNDKNDINDSQVVLVNISDPPVGFQMWGTPMEIIYSWQQGREVIIITDNIATLSPWVVYHMDHAVTSVEEAIAYLEKKYCHETV